MKFSGQGVKRFFLILSWAMYDMANQFFALNIVSLYFVRWLTLEKNTPELFYSIVFGVSTAFVALLAPVLGTIADIRSWHRLFLILFTLLCVFFTMILGITYNVYLALIFFGIANIGCQQAIIFYNALMFNISPRHKIGLVSGVGKMFGYFGAIIALIFTKSIIMEKGYQAVFLFTGILFFICALPCMIFVKDRPQDAKLQQNNRINKKQIMDIFKRMKTTLLNARDYGGLKEFLKAAFFGLCVVNVAMLFMSVYATKVFGLDNVQIINFIAFATVFAILGSIGSGIISDRIGYKQTMIWVFGLWIICLFGGALAIPPFHWFIGALAGISLGSTWVVSRALVISLVPPEKVGEAFGLFNLVGYLAGITGPIVWGIMLIALKPLGIIGYRIALMYLVPFVVVGGVFLIRINVKK